MTETGSAPTALSIVGPGRAGGSIASAAARAGVEVNLIGRESADHSFDGQCLLLCLPDADIAAFAASVGAGEGRPKMIGHVSGATPLDPLLAAGAADGCFSAAIAGSSEQARATAAGLARVLGMLPFEVDEGDRVAYHAAASIASNFLVTLEQSAADLLGGIGVENPREVLAPLVRRSLENWIAGGPAALTGPIARGDEDTVERHRQAILQSEPGLLPLYDALAGATRKIGAA